MELESYSFPLSYKAEVVEFSPSGVPPQREYLASDGSMNHGPWLLVRICPDQAAPWLGAFEFFDYSATGLYGMPSGSELLVVAGGMGYVVSVCDAAQWHRLPIIPVLGVRRVADCPILTLWDHQDLAAYGPEGILWRVTRLGQDELVVESADASGIAGTIWCGGAPGSGHVRFVVDPWSGRVIQGPTGDAFSNARTLTGLDAWDH